VHGFERVPEQDALCGSIVRLITNQGNFSLDDTHLYHPTFGEVYATGHFDAERRLAAHHGRRMSTAALVGFFNFVEESDFECYTEWKGQKEEILPNPPTVPYSYTSHVQRKCQAEDGKQQCVPQMKLEYPQRPGASDDLDTMTTVTHVLITDDAQFEVTFYPNHPLQREVVIRQKNPAGGNGTMSHYQLFGSDPSTLFCNQEPVDESEFAMNMSDSFLSYIGKQNHSFMGLETEVRKWRMSLAFGGKKLTAQEQNGLLGPIEFWDTAAKNHTPYRLFSPGSRRVHDSVYRSFKGSMSASDVQDWLTDNLFDSQNGLDPMTCDSTVGTLKYQGEEITAPVMSGSPFSESAVKFYAKHYKIGEGPGDLINWWPSTYFSYWKSQTERLANGFKLDDLSKKLNTLETQLAEVTKELKAKAGSSRRLGSELAPHDHGRGQRQLNENVRTSWTKTYPDDMPEILTQYVPKEGFAIADPNELTDTALCFGKEIEAVGAEFGICADARASYDTDLCPQLDTYASGTFYAEKTSTPAWAKAVGVDVVVAGAITYKHRLCFTEDLAPQVHMVHNPPGYSYHTPTCALASFACQPNDFVLPNERVTATNPNAAGLVSKNGEWALFMQYQGNAVIYPYKNGQPQMGAHVWATSNGGVVKQPVSLIPQIDGNVVIYDADMRPIWNSGSRVPGGVTAGKLVMQNYGNLVYYGTKGEVIWYSDSNARAHTVPLGVRCGASSAISEHGDDKTPRECASLCDSTAGCKGFEHWPKCVLLNTLGCGESSVDTYTKDVLGYTQLEKGCIKGHDIATHASKTAAECAALCDADAACEAFEHGKKYREFKTKSFPLTGGKVSGFSSYWGNHPMFHPNEVLGDDGDYKTWLCPDRTSCWVTIDLGSVKTAVSSFRMKNTRNRGYHDRGTKNYKIETSTDNTNWSTAATGSLFTNTRLDFATNTGPTSVRYVKFTAESWYGYGGGLGYLQAVQEVSETPPAGVRATDECALKSDKVKVDDPEQCVGGIENTDLYVAGDAQGGPLYKGVYGEADWRSNGDLKPGTVTSATTEQSIEGKVSIRVEKNVCFGQGMIAYASIYGMAEFGLKYNSHGCLSVAAALRAQGKAAVAGPLCVCKGQRKGTAKWWQGGLCHDAAAFGGFIQIGVEMDDICTGEKPDIHLSVSGGLRIQVLGFALNLDMPEIVIIDKEGSGKDLFGPL
jgi:hypothetical protein